LVPPTETPNIGTQNELTVTKIYPQKMEELDKVSHQQEVPKEEIDRQAQEESMEEENEKMKSINQTFIPSKSIIYEETTISNIDRTKDYQPPTYNVESGKYCECCGSENCTCCVIIQQLSDSCRCCGQARCSCCPSSSGFYCFSGDTIVNTNDGNIKKMDELEIGDWVLSVNKSGVCFRNCKIPTLCKSFIQLEAYMSNFPPTPEIGEGVTPQPASQNELRAPREPRASGMRGGGLRAAAKLKKL
jgi:hypothetical protein